MNRGVMRLRIALIVSAVASQTVASKDHVRESDPDIPIKLAAADRIFAAKKYAEALKAYRECDRKCIGTAGYVMERIVDCSRKTNDHGLRMKTMKRLCELPLDKRNLKYVENAFRVRYREMCGKVLRTGEFEAFFKETVKKFNGTGIAVVIANDHVRNLFMRGKWIDGERFFRANSIAWPTEITNAVRFVSAHLVRTGEIDENSAVSFDAVYTADRRLGELLVSRCVQQKGVWRLYELIGDSRVQNGDADGAIAAYTEALVFADASLDVLDYKIVNVRLASARNRRNAIADALEFLKSPCKPERHRRVFFSVVDAMAKERLYDRLVALTADGTLCRAEYLTSELQKTVAVAEKALKGAEKKSEVPKTAVEIEREFFTAVQALRKRKRYAEAVAECDRFIKEDHQRAAWLQAYRLSGDICFEDLSDFVEAERRYESTMAEDKSAACALSLGIRRVACLLSLGRADTAKKLLDKIERMTQNNLDPQGEMKISHLRVLAAAPVRRGVAEAERKLMSAEAFFASGEFGKALNLYRQAVSDRGAKRPTVMSAQMQEARCLARLRQNGKAIECYQTFVRKYGRCRMSADALMRMAVLYAGPIDDVDKALKCYVRIETEYPGEEITERAMFYRMTLAMFVNRWEDAESARLGLVKVCKNPDMLDKCRGDFAVMIRNRKLKFD